MLIKMNDEILPTMKVKSPSQQSTEWPNHINNNSTYKKCNITTQHNLPKPNKTNPSTLSYLISTTS